MAKEKKKGGVTLANVIAVVGIALLAVALFLGYRFSGDNESISAIKTVAWAAGFSLLLWILIKAKSAKEGSAVKWRVVEGVVLLLYIGAAVVSSPQVARFFDVYAQSDRLKTAADNDVNTLRHAIRNFQNDEGEALQQTVRGMRNIVEQQAEGDQLTTALSDYLTDCIPDFGGSLDELTLSKVGAFETYWQTTIDDLTDADQNAYAETWEEQLNRCNSRIQSWNVLQIPEALASMDELSEEIGTTLEQISATLPFKAINRLDDGRWDVADEHQAYRADFDTELADEAATVKKFSPIGIGACVLLHLLILFNYFMAYRRRTVRPSSKTNTDNDGGTLLTID